MNKDTKLELNDKNFLMEFGKYFLTNLKEEFNLFIFERKLVNVNKWKRIFDLPIQSEEELRSLLTAVKKIMGKQD